MTNYGSPIESQWGRYFPRHLDWPPEAHSSSRAMGTCFFPTVKRPERGANISPHSSAGLRMDKSHTSAFSLSLSRHVMGVPFTFTDDKLPV